METFPHQASLHIDAGGDNGVDGIIFGEPFEVVEGEFSRHYLALDFVWSNGAKAGEDIRAVREICSHGRHLMSGEF
ncbi:MAG: hypothetical protein OD811_02660 [Alphaproteobacteria bacterium]